MSKFTVSLLVLISFLFVKTSAFAEPPNLALARQKVITYYQNGNYQKELTTTIEKARIYLHKRVLNNTNNPKKLALVLDIDETSLSNVQRIIQENFSQEPAKVHRGIMAANSPPIKPMLQLFNEAKAKGVAVFFVTGRFKSQEIATKSNLLKAGYRGWTGLYLRPNTYSKPSVIPFKSEARAAIEEQGYTIIATIGDQYSDVTGGHAEKGFKLPNPFYYLP